MDEVESAPVMYMKDLSFDWGKENTRNLYSIYLSLFGNVLVISKHNL
jgi:hypothetical protein